MTEAAHDNHDCARFSVLYAAMKKKIIDTSLLISKYTEVTQENERLRRQLQDAQQLTDTLHGDCDRYKKEACAALTQIDPLKQRCNRLQEEVNLLSQQKQELQLAVNSSQATLKQYEALVEELKHKQLPKSTPKPNAGRNKVLILKKKLEERKAQLKQVKRSLREDGLEMKQMRTRCKSAVEGADSLGKRQKEREDESEAERDARHLEELLTDDVYEEASICDVEEIFTEMRLPALLEPLSPDPVPKS